MEGRIEEILKEIVEKLKVEYEPIKDFIWFLCSW